MFKCQFHSVHILTPWMLEGTSLFITDFTFPGVLYQHVNIRNFRKVKCDSYKFTCIISLIDKDRINSHSLCWPHVDIQLTKFREILRHSLRERLNSVWPCDAIWHCTYIARNDNLALIWMTPCHRVGGDPFSHLLLQSLSKHNDSIIPCIIELPDYIDL